LSDHPHFLNQDPQKPIRISTRTTELFNALLESAPDAMLVVDERGIILLANSQTEKLFGYSREELIGQTVEKLMPARFRAAHANHRGQFFSTPRLRPMEAGLDLYALRRDGSEFPVEISLNPIAAEGRSLVTSSIRDISHRRRAEQELRRAYDELDRRVLQRTAELEKATAELRARIDLHEHTENELRQSEERFRLLVEGVRDYAIFMLDPEGVVVSWNAGAERIYGFTAEEAIGGSFSRFHLFSEESQVEAPEYGLEQAAAAGQFVEETWRIRKDGRRFRASVLTTALRDEGGRLRGFSRITRDVTEKHELELRLRHAQRLEAIGRLAGGVAHEFNNSATAILGYSSLIIDNVQDNPQLRHYAEEVQKAGQRAAAVTRQLLAFSRQQILQPTLLNLNDVVTDIEKMLHRLIGENIRVLTELDPYLGVVKADPTQMAQVVVNLALNARDAMPDGGVIIIETGNVDVDCAFAADNHLAPGPHVRLRVSDTGTGLDRQTASHIFEPFFTTKPVGSGTGLGLSTVYGTVKQSGGGILVFSELGHGATFEIYLPRLEQACVKPELLSPRRESGGGSEAVLVVEDDNSLRWLTCQMLTQFGYTVVEAQDASHALALARERAGDVDLLITDVVMPGLNGRQLARQIRQLYPHIKVLLMSGYTAEIAAQTDKGEAALPFLEKPFTPEELGSKVREVLDQDNPARLPKGA